MDSKNLATLVEAIEQAIDKLQSLDGFKGAMSDDDRNAVAWHIAETADIARHDPDAAIDELNHIEATVDLMVSREQVERYIRAKAAVIMVARVVIETAVAAARAAL